ncbi:MAG: hypothetical protein KKB37_00575, partial [Alphaproteobacteria bacterium]|nr:hypothetical protein [Alphaproteobacteria bacterium]
AGRLTVATIHEHDSYRKTPVSKHRICRLNPLDAEKIKARDGDLVELDFGAAAPLRAWLVVDPEIGVGAAPLDTAGHTMLRINTGDRITIRRLGEGRTMALELS